MRKFMFMDTSRGKALVLPVTPPSFEVSSGINVETINIHLLGDVILPGHEMLPSMKVSCMFPSKKYPFNQRGALETPYDYIKIIQNWCEKHIMLRFIVSNTPVNIPVIVTDIRYGEKDGSGDVYATINLRQYRSLLTEQPKDTGNKGRTVEKIQSSVDKYVIKKGDTLSAICRKFYGSAALYNKLAAYNEIKNPNLIYSGQTLKLPDRDILERG